MQSGDNWRLRFLKFMHCISSVGNKAEKWIQKVQNRNDEGSGLLLK